MPMPQQTPSRGAYGTVLDILQGASNAAADNVAAPVDGLAWLLRKAGVPVGEAPVGGSAWMRQLGLTAQPKSQAAGLVGETLGLTAPIAAAAKAPQIAAGMLQMAENAAAPSTMAGAARGQRGALDFSGYPAGADGSVILRPGQQGFDPRFDPRKKEQARLRGLEIEVQPRPMQEAPTVSLADYEGRHFITSMSDRTAAGGLLTRINDVELSRPVNLRGGQDYMFDNPGQVWASAQAPVTQITKMAKELKKTTGQDPLFLPWRMAPSGGDFAAMNGEAMLTYADSALGKRAKAQLDKAIKAKIPDWSGVAAAESVEQFRSAPDKVRKKLMKMMDTEFRNAGGLSIGEARLAVTDPKQLTGRDGGLMNVGEIAAGSPVIKESGHPWYPRGIPGQGIGRLDRDIGVYQLLRGAARDRGIPDALQPRAIDIRALQMKPYRGLIDEDLLKSLGY